MKIAAKEDSRNRPESRVERTPYEVNTRVVFGDAAHPQPFEGNVFAKLYILVQRGMIEVLLAKCITKYQACVF